MMGPIRGGGGHARLTLAVAEGRRKQSYLPQELGVRVDELAVLLLQLRVADLGGAGFLWTG